MANGLVDMLAQRGIGIREQSENDIETDWVTWVSEDEEVEIGSRFFYLVSKRTIVMASRLTWLIGVKVLKRNLYRQLIKERYNAFLTNLVMAKYDENLRAEAAP